MRGGWGSVEGMSDHRVIIALLLIGAWALLRFRHIIWLALIYVMLAPPEDYDRKIKPTERCWACGAQDGELEAVMESPPIESGSQRAKQLFVKYKCKACGATQLFAPIVPSGEIKIEVCARVGPVQGKDKDQI
jgi:hypothetical protein